MSLSCQPEEQIRLTVTDSQYRQKVCTARTAEEIFVETIAVKTRILNDRVLLEAARAIGDRLIAGYRAGARVFMCGNGGSALRMRNILPRS